MQLIWSAPARADLYRIADYYGRLDPDLPLRLLERIEAAPQPLIDSPNIGSLTPRRGVRKWPVRSTPFYLLYAVRADRVEIRRVVHGSSDYARE